MQINGPSPAQGPQPTQNPPRAHQAESSAPRPHIAVTDELDISREAELMSRMSELPEIRADKVAELKAAIEAGTYETTEKLEGAVDRILDELA